MKWKKNRQTGVGNEITREKTKLGRETSTPPKQEKGQSEFEI